MNDPRFARRPQPQIPNEQERSRLAAIRDDVDAAAERVHPLQPPPPQVPQPVRGEPQRDAVAALIDDHVRVVCDDIDGLIKQLNAMKQQVLVGSATAKQVLNEHINICLSVSSETDRIADVIDELAKKALRDL